MSSCRRCIVHGRVQGVWFRDTTRRKAEQLGLNGHAINLPDGTVEVVVHGNGDAVTALCEWLWRGSPHSRVTQVDCQACEPSGHPGFEIG